MLTLLPLGRRNSGGFSKMWREVKAADPTGPHLAAAVFTTLSALALLGER